MTIKRLMQLKERKDALCLEIDELKKRVGLVEMERDRLQQFWTTAKCNLIKEKDFSIAVQKRYHNAATAHARQLALLKKQIRMLLLNTRTYCVASTQTDPILETEDRRSEGVQTVEELNREYVMDVVKKDDRELVEFIQQIIHERSVDRAEHRRALLELEQRLKDEHLIEIGKLRGEKLRDFEELSSSHRQKLSAINAKFLAEKELNAELECRMQREGQRLNQRVGALEDEVNGLKDDHIKYESEVRALRKENEALSSELQWRRVQSANRYRNMDIIKDLKEKLAKSDDLKEIVLGEYRKLEMERDALAKALNTRF
ncbi:unnamed protein product [Anisakis simplex]|uniref:DUF4201 domain-containing protein n=1 Tax=Anisakis simplex TaxID=6269 RepID=A0A0M3JZ86_ANISI|nr:unnamed protein product [Anisakis simplex]